MKLLNPTVLRSKVTGRLSAVPVAAIIATATLFWIMQAAIDQEGTIVDPVLKKHSLALVKPRPDEEPERNIRKTPPPPPPIEHFPPPPNLKFVGEEPSLVPTRYTPPVTGPGKINAVGQVDGDALPLVTVAPDYPRRPLTQGVEGWVIVEFIIDKLGRVRDAKVVDAQPRQVFDKAALKAVQHYKYKPKVLNGEAMPVHGVRHRIVFNLS